MWLKCSPSLSFYLSLSAQVNEFYYLYIDYLIDSLIYTLSELNHHIQDQRRACQLRANAQFYTYDRVNSRENKYINRENV